MKKRILSLLLVLTMLLSIAPAMTVFVSAGDTAEATLTVGSYTVFLPKGVTLPEGADSGTTVTAVTANDTVWGTESTTTWYVATGTVTIDHTLTVKGNVHIILADNCNLTVNVSAENSAGINVTGDNSLTVYAQSIGSAMGKLTANGGACAAGIGGGYGADGKNITINGGTVTATGGSLNSWGYCDGGAGIGGGYNGDGKFITINGGTVIAQGGYYAAGIGGGYNTGSKGNGDSITINGGNVTATGGNGEFGGGAGIGGGIDGIGSNIAITGGTVTATCGSKNDDTFEDGAAIGNGHTNTVHTASNIKVSAGLVVQSDNNNPPTTVIAHTDETDLASSFVNKQYATIEPPVCRIGETIYTSIAAALAADHSDEKETTPTVITLIADDTENVTIPTGRYITLDLNGHVLKAAEPDSPATTASVITNNGTLTVKDGGKTTVHYFTYVKEGAWTLDGETPTENIIELKDLTFDSVEDASATKVYHVKITGGVITGGTGTYITQSATTYGISILGIYGGGIVNSGTLTVTGGNLVGNKASKGGGGILNMGTATFKDDGKIFGNEITDYGGGIYNGGTFTADGISVLFNTSGNVGGGVYNTNENSGAGKLIINNTTISYNTTKSLSGGGVYNSGTMLFGGNTIVTDNLVKSVISTSENNLCPTVSGLITIGTGDNGCPAPGDNMKIGIKFFKPKGSPTGQFTTNGTANDVRYFISDNIAYKVKFNNKGTDDTTDDYLEIANFNIDTVAADTASVILEKKKMTSEQAIAIAKAQMSYTGLSKDTVIAYAYGVSEGKYAVITANQTTDWAVGTAEMSIAEMKAALSGESSKAAFVIGSASNHSHEWTYSVDTADTTGATLKATCTNDGHTGNTTETITIVKPALTTYGGTESANASIKDSETSLGGITTLTIKYQKKTGESTYDTETATAPTKAGTYRASITVDTDKTAYVEYTIAKKELTVDGSTASNKTYDGTKDATITSNGTLKDYIANDTVSIDKATGNFADENVGTGIKVTVSYTLTGADAGNYTVKNSETTADITKAANTISTLTINGWAVGETAKKPVISTLFGDNQATYQYKVKGADDSTYTTEVPTEVGEYTLKATSSSSDNYDAATATADFAITEKSDKGGLIAKIIRTIFHYKAFEMFNIGEFLARIVEQIFDIFR